VESVTPHNHAPDGALNDEERAKAEIRDRASNSVEKPRQVVINCTTGLSDEAAVLMPKYSASQRTIERKRKLEGVQMPAPSALRDIAILAPLMLTHRNEDFLLWDSGTEDASRIIMFGTRGNLQVLEDNPHWFIDGTFKVAPTLFTQLTFTNGDFNNLERPHHLRVYLRRSLLFVGWRAVVLPKW
jgi:hypothetical protein